MQTSNSSDHCLQPESGTEFSAIFGLPTKYPITFNVAPKQRVSMCQHFGKSYESAFWAFGSGMLQQPPGCVAKLPFLGALWSHRAEALHNCLNSLSWVAVSGAP